MALVNEELYDLPEDVKTQTTIQNRYCFWCHRRGGAKTSNNYEDSMKQIASFQTVEHFWRIYNHMHRPTEFKTTTDFHLFKNGIKPTWEDTQNERGGKWMVRLKKGLASRYWEEVVLAIIGEQFDVGQEICGAVVSVRHNEDIISVWNKTADNTEAKNKIRDQMRRILKLPQFIAIEYKKHQDSIVDKSSFRNTVVWRSAASRGDWSDAGNEKRQYHSHHHEGGEGSTTKEHRSPRTHTGEYRSPRVQGAAQAPASSATGGAWKTHRYDKDGGRGGDGTSPREPKFNTASQAAAPNWSKAAANATATANDKPTSGWHRAGDTKNPTGSSNSAVDGDGDSRKRSGSGNLPSSAPSTDANPWRRRVQDVTGKSDQTS